MDIIQIIEELNSTVNSATRVPGIRNRVIVDVERLTKVGQELQSSIPSDILEAKEILKQKNSIINQSQLEARRVKEAAEKEGMAIKAAAEQEQASRLDETEIVKEAQTKAEDTNQNALQEAQQIVQEAQRMAYRIMDEAETAAGERREGADQYARETLFDLEERLSGMTAQVRGGIDSLGLETETKAAPNPSPSFEPAEEAVAL
jgi:vacuolar-type H+-ATPase subunit H